MTVYPLLAWIPIFGADVNVPSLPTIPGGGGGAVDKSLAGALMFGGSVERGPWRVDADGIWATFQGDRVALPTLTVDLDVVYAHASGGRKVVKDLYVTGGVRWLSLEYNIQIGTLPTFTSKPGLWDPLVGVSWTATARRRSCTRRWKAAASASALMWMSPKAFASTGSQSRILASRWGTAAST